MLILNRRRVKRKIGQLVQIDLGDQRYSLAIILREPLIAFYDRLFLGREIEDFHTENLPVAFTLMVMNHAVTSGRWPVVGEVEVPERLQNAPKFCKRDTISGDLSIYQEIKELAPNYERPAKLGECTGLETAAVWEPEHVEDRLRDHYTGISNKWVEQLRVAR